MNSQEVVDFINERMAKDVELKVICDEVNNKIFISAIFIYFLITAIQSLLGPKL